MRRGRDAAQRRDFPTVQTMRRTPVSVVVLAKNEAGNLPGCLGSVAWCDDVLVLDSLSSDDTANIAAEYGARCFQRKFDNFAGQRNYALDHIDFRHEWVFHLDADERFTPQLLAECHRAIAEDRYSGFMVPSKMMLWGKWLKHAAQYPVYQMRLMKLGEVRFVEHGHGQRETEVKRGIGKLTEPYIHHSFSKGFGEWLDRHNRYSTREAQQAVETASANVYLASGLLSLDRTVRRRALKQLAARMPFRPWLKFAYMYFLRMGFLDGVPGLTYCTLQGIYEYMICLKIKELKRAGKGVPG